ncbi:MAG: arsenate reductase ArsC [Pseudomonadota bacterium]
MNTPPDITRQSAPMVLPGGASVLFSCTLNSIRSPMAEALMKKLTGTRFYVDSAGLRSAPVDPMAVRVMDELGHDISSHRSKTFDDLGNDFFDLIITLSPQAHHRALEITRLQACEVEYWPTYDPLLQEGSQTQRMDAFRQVRDSLAERLNKRFAPA